MICETSVWAAAVVINLFTRGNEWKLISVNDTGRRLCLLFASYAIVPFSTVQLFVTQQLQQTFSLFITVKSRMSQMVWWLGLRVNAMVDLQPYCSLIFFSPASQRSVVCTCSLVWRHCCDNLQDEELSIFRKEVIAFIAQNYVDAFGLPKVARLVENCCHLRVLSEWIFHIVTLRCEKSRL